MDLTITNAELRYDGAVRLTFSDGTTQDVRPVRDDGKGLPQAKLHEARNKVGAAIWATIGREVQL